MRGGFAEVLRYSYDVAPLRCVDMPTRLQITAFFFIRAIGTRKTEQSLRKTEQKNSRPLIWGGSAYTWVAGRGARRYPGGCILNIRIVQIMRVSCRDVGTRKSPIWERVICLVLRRLVAHVPHTRVRAEPLVAVALARNYDAH